MDIRVSIKHVEEWSKLQEIDGLSAQDAAEHVWKKYGFIQKPQTIERELRKVRSFVGASLLSLPDYRPEFPADVRISFRSCMLMPDIHAPNNHREALQDALLMAKARKVDTAILLGDTIDNEWCSSFLDEAKVSGMANTSDIIKNVYLTLKAITDTFREVYVVRGNHSERFLKRFDKNLGMAEMLKVFAVPTGGGESVYNKLIPVERYHMYMDGGPTGDWLFAHQTNYSVVRGKVAQDMATSHEINVVTSHIHDLAITTSRNKHRYYAVAPGCLADETKMSYKQMRVGTGAPWILGWAIINERGIPEVFHYTKEYGVL